MPGLFPEMMARLNQGEREESVLELAKEVKDLMEERVRRRDIRRAATLRDIFPSAFPPALRRGSLQAFMSDTEEVEWMLAPDPAPMVSHEEAKLISEAGLLEAVPGLRAYTPSKPSGSADGPSP